MFFKEFSSAHSAPATNCATVRRSIHDQFPSDRCADQSAALGCPQGSAVPQVQSQVFKQLVRRADLFSLQKIARMADRCAA